MAIQIYPTPVSSSSGGAYNVAATITNAFTPYKVTQTLDAGIYSITWAGGGTVTFELFSGNTLISTSAATSPLAINLASTATSYTLWNSVGGAIVQIQLTSSSVAPVTGTLTTYTTSGTLTDTGYAYWTLVGGGGSGGSNNKTGGCSGGVFGGRVLLTGSMAYTIGAGAARTSGGANGSAGGNSTFNGVTAGGGPGGIGGASQPTPTANGGAGGAYYGKTGGESASAIGFVSIFGALGGNGTTGGGGAGTNQHGGFGQGGGSGIGRGGNGSRTDAADGTGYGAGGGGGGQYGGQQGGAGTPGVLYIIK